MLNECCAAPINRTLHFATVTAGAAAAAWAGTGLFAIFIFSLLLVVLSVASIFLEKLRVALIGGGFCMLVTVALFVLLAPRAPKFVDDQVDGTDGSFNIYGRLPFPPAPLSSPSFVGVCLGTAAVT